MYPYAGGGDLLSNYFDRCVPLHVLAWRVAMCDHLAIAPVRNGMREGGHWVQLGENVHPRSRTWVVAATTRRPNH